MGVRIMLGIVVGILGIGMLLYLVPQGTDVLTGTETVATVGDQVISVSDVQDQLSRISRNGQFPPGRQALYPQQVPDQLGYKKSLPREAARLGRRVTAE